MLSHSQLKETREPSRYSDDVWAMLSDARADNAVKNSLTPDDAAGVIKEFDGIEILRPDGTPFNHLREAGEAFTAVRNQADRIEQMILGRGDLTGREIEILRRKADELADILVTYSDKTGYSGPMIHDDQDFQREYEEALRGHWTLLDGWILNVGKNQQFQFEPEVREFLVHERPELRAQAIRTLGARWGLASFRGECEKLFAAPPDHPEVWAAACPAGGSTIVGLVT